MVADRWLMLSLLFLARTAMGFQFQSVGSTGPILVNALDFRYAAVGTLIGLYLLPGVFVSIPSGVIGERLGARRIVAAGLLMMAAGGALMSAGTGFYVIASGRLVSGIGAVLVNVLLTKMVADWFAGREMATAMAILVTSWPVGIALGLLALVPLAHWLDWQAAMEAPALVALLCAATVVAFYCDPPGAAAQPARLRIDLSAREGRLICGAGFIWGAYNVGYILLVSFLPAHLGQQGYELAGANALVSWLGWGLVIFVPVGGYVADRLHRPDIVMMTGFVIAGIAAACLAARAFPVLPAFAVAAVAIGLPAGPIMTLPASAVRSQNRATGMGIYFTWYYALMAVFPAAAGWARDVTHNSGAPIYFAAVMIAAAIAGLAAFRLLARPDRL